MRAAFLTLGAGLFGALLTGCVVGDDSLAIGRFSVEATLTKDCGQDTFLAAPKTRRFSVFLRKSGAQSVLWDQEGDRRWYTLDADGAFGGESGVLVDLRADVEDVSDYGLSPEDFPLDGSEPDPEEPPTGESVPPCVISRVDALDAQLEPDDASGASNRFTGTLRHRYDATEGSDCTDFLKLPFPLARELPCELRYQLDATRKR